MEKEQKSEGKRVPDYRMILAGGLSRGSAGLFTHQTSDEGEAEVDHSAWRKGVYWAGDREATGEDTMTHKRKVQDNALKAVLRTPMFKQRVVKARKGKGSYQRNGKQQGGSGGSEAPSVGVYCAA
jgi:alternative ribosome-rescue factor